MIKNEYKSTYSSLMTNQKEITRHLRAAIIDWLFEVGSKMDIKDKTVLYESANLMDRFYSKVKKSYPSSDLQLTAVTALLISSKNLEVEPIDLDTCIKQLCFKKYSRSQFLNKEKDIRKLTGYENETPTTLDFLMLYIKLIKWKL